jgi:capsule polysaccharide export protein KpsE/RkpR
METK